MGHSHKVSNYWQVGIRVNQPTSAVTAIANLFVGEEQHPGVVISGEQGVVEGNRVEKSPPKNSK